MEINIEEVKQLLNDGKNVEVLTPDGWVKILKYQDKGVNEAYELSFSCGKKLIATNDHKIETTTGWVEVGKLEKGNKIVTLSGYSTFLSIKPVGIRYVCDISVDHPNHRFYADGVSVHNCIYQFRHADPRYLDEDNLKTVYENVNTLYLTYNFRSAHPIVKLGNMLRAYAKSEVIQKPAEFTKPLPKRVFIQKVKNQVNEGKTVANHVKQLIKDGAELKDIAVLTRTNKYISTTLEPAFIELNIPYIIQGSKTRKLTDKSEVAFLIHCFQLMVAPPRAQVFIMKQILENIQGIGPVTANQTYEYMSSNIWGLINLSGKVYNCLANLVRFVQECSLKGLEVIKIGYYIDNFLELSKFDLKPNYVTELKQLFSNWAEIYIEDTGKSLEQIIPEIQSSLDSVEEESVNAVKLGSIHAAKGLEYKHVVASGFTYRTSKQAKPTQEELNIFYVQVSRAIESLLIVHSDIITYMGQEMKGHKMKWLIKLIQDLEN